MTVQECWAMVRTQRESAQLERIQIPRKQVAYGPLRRCSTLLSLFFCLDLFEISQQKNQMPERETERDRETNEGEGEEEDWWRRCVFAAEFQPNCQRFFFFGFLFLKFLRHCNSFLFSIIQVFGISQSRRRLNAIFCRWYSEDGGLKK